MSNAFLFAGQASQFVGMGKALYEKDQKSRDLLLEVDTLLGYSLSDVMFNGPEEELTKTVHTQPAVFVHSILIFNQRKDSLNADAVAGHSLGEISALVAAGALEFEDGLFLVQKRAEAMQMACEKNPGTMAAILGLADESVEMICESIEGIAVPANYNCPGQLVISGSNEAVKSVMDMCIEKGAKRAINISVGGAFHSPLMEPAYQLFLKEVENTTFSDARIPVYQNVDAQPHQDAETIKNNLVNQIIKPVLWTQSILNMIDAGVSNFVEIGGKGRILKGMIRKISREVNVNVWTEND